MLGSELIDSEIEDAGSSSEEKMVVGLLVRPLMLSGSDLSKRLLTVFSRGVLVGCCIRPASGWYVSVRG